MRKNKVHIVALSKEINEILCHQKEIIQVSKDENYRPFLIILKLKYKGKKYMFALPLRSNIGNAPKETYFSLPNRKSTRSNRKHGLHYIKMFPIHNRYFRKYYFDDSVYGKFIVAYIEKYLCLIAKEAQLYLDNYANGKRYKYCVDIDDIIEKLGL